MTHLCVSKLTSIASENGLSPGRRQAIIWNNAGILLIGPLGTNFGEILIEIQKFSLNKIRLKISSAKCRPFCLGLNVLTAVAGTYHSTAATAAYWPIKSEQRNIWCSHMIKMTIQTSEFNDIIDINVHMSWETYNTGYDQPWIKFQVQNHDEVWSRLASTKQVSSYSSLYGSHMRIDCY